MRLCMPTVDDGGLDAMLSAHFGSAPYLTVVESDSGEVEVMANPRAEHAPGTCEAAKGLDAHAVDAVVSVGLGRRAFAGLRDAGIQAFLTGSRDVKGALEQFRAGRLVPLTADEACHGGRHEGEGCRDSET